MQPIVVRRIADTRFASERAAATWSSWLFGAGDEKIDLSKDEYDKLQDIVDYKPDEANGTGEILFADAKVNLASCSLVLIEDLRDGTEERVVVAIDGLNVSVSEGSSLSASVSLGQLLFALSRTALPPSSLCALVLPQLLVLIRACSRRCTRPLGI